MKRIDLSQDLTGLERLTDDDYAIAEGKTVDLQMQECQLQLQTEGKQNACAINPLEIDLVLDNLFPFCTVNTLKNCRLVNKQWRNASLKAWRDKAILCLGKDEEISSVITYVNLLHSNSNSTEDKSLQLEKYPFKNFRMNQCSLVEYLRGTESELSDMARHVILQNFNEKMVQIEECISRSPSLKILELRNCDWSWGWTAREFPLRASNMKHFTILQDIDPIYTRSRPWYAFFARFGKLEALSIKYRTPKDCLADIWKILVEFDCTKTTGREGKVARLKELELIHVPKTRLRYGNPVIRSNGDIIKSIVAYNFPLVSLTLHLLWTNEDLEAELHPIYRLLDSYKETLQYLKTSFIFNSGEETVKLHLQKKKANPNELHMEALKEVHLSNGLPGLVMVILADLDLPNLKKIVVDSEECINGQMDDKEFYLSLPKERMYESLETLEFLDSRKIPGPNTIKTLAKIMPNLVHLTMPLDKFTFEIVCEHFKGLKTLNALAAQCRYEELDDEILTGISPVKGPGETRRPNITDLAHLQDLTIACERPDLPFPFTDHSVTYGLLQLPPLHTLSIRFKEISDENMTKLVNHVRGYVNVQVKPKSFPESYCDVEAGFDEPADFLEMRVQ